MDAYDIKLLALVIAVLAGAYAVSYVFVRLILRAIFRWLRPSKPKPGILLNGSIAAVILSLIFGMLLSATLLGHRAGSSAPTVVERTETSRELAADQRQKRRQDRLDAASRSFKQLNVVYHPLHVLPYNRPTKFVLTIASSDLAKARELATELDRSNGAPTENRTERIAGPIAFSNDVTASLSTYDPSVTVTLIGPHDPDDATALTKAVTKSANVTWIWSVVPKTLDDFDLTLQLTNKVRIDRELVPIDGPTYEDTFKIKASHWDKFSHFVVETHPVVSAVGTIVVVITGIAGWFSFRKRKSKGDEKSDPDEKSDDA